MTEEPLLSIRGLRAGYGGIPVVFHLDLDVGEGEIVALLGANGAGKTTTLRAVSGMIPPMAGTVTLAGERMSYADLAAAAHLSVVDYLSDVPWQHDETAKNWYARVKSRPSFRPLLADALPGIPASPSYADLDF